MKRVLTAVGIAVLIWLVIEFVAWQTSGNSELFFLIFGGRTFSLF